MPGAHQADLAELRVVVCTPGEGRRGMLELPESVASGEFIGGGERSLYELAAALAVLGVRVELRGAVHAQILKTITDAAGAAPTIGLGPRRPEPGEVVILPEALNPPDLYVASHLSGALPVVHMLAPAGLWGWGFQPDWALPDPMTVAVDAVGTPQSYRAMEALGFSMWTNARGIAAAGRQAGTRVTWIGTGTPVPFPDPIEKTVDLAIVERNRWHPIAEEVARRVPGASVLRIPGQSLYSLSEALAPARILVWPSRLEGMSRIAREARAVGTVPVALDTNPFSSAEDHGDGTVLVPDVDSLAEEAIRLLGDRDELNGRARRAVKSARAQADWGRFLSRVSSALTRLPISGAAGARAEFAEHALLQHNSAIEAVRREAAEFAEHALLQHNRAIDAVQRESAKREDELLTRIHETQVELTATQTLLAAYQARRVIRLLDASLVGRAIHAVRSNGETSAHPDAASASIRSPDRLKR